MARPLMITIDFAHIRRSGTRQGKTDQVVKLSKTRLKLWIQLLRGSRRWRMISKQENDLLVDYMANGSIHLRRVSSATRASWRVLPADRERRGRQWELLGRDRVANPPYNTFSEWHVKYVGSDIMPFQFPDYASLEPIPIRLIMAASGDIPTEIVFLCIDCPRLRVIGSIVYPNEPSRYEKPSLVVAFAGVREKKA